jgi:hypothetical protein
MTTEKDSSDRAGTAPVAYGCADARKRRLSEVEAESRSLLTDRDALQSAAEDAYTDARKAAEVVAGQARTTNDATLQDLRCKIGKDRTDAVNSLWATLRGELQDSSPAPGCRRPPCRADDAVGTGETPADLAGRVAAMRYEAKALDAYFGTLVDEQKNLTDRVGTVQSDVDELSEEVKNAAAEADLIPFYVRARVLRWRLSHAELWAGFTVDTYLECLRDTFDCLRREWDAIAVLESVIVEHDCVAAQQLLAAADRKAKAADTLLSRYQRGGPAARGAAPAEHAQSGRDRADEDADADAEADDEATAEATTADPDEDQDQDQDQD